MRDLIAIFRYIFFAVTYPVSKAPKAAKKYGYYMSSCVIISIIVFIANTSKSTPAAIIISFLAIFLVLLPLSLLIGRL